MLLARRVGDPREPFIEVESRQKTLSLSRNENEDDLGERALARFLGLSGDADIGGRLTADEDATSRLEGRVIDSNVTATLGNEATVTNQSPRDC